MNALESRNEALEQIDNIRTELARLHWYAHQFVCGKAGIDKDDVLIEFANATSEIGMALNFLSKNVGDLGRLATEAERAAESAAAE